MPKIQQILECIDGQRQYSPLVIAISGFAGSGKSTLARQLNSMVSGSARIRGDDFLDPSRSHRRSPDWDGVDRNRLRRQVIDPFRNGRNGMFQRYDWAARALGSPEPIPSAEVLIIDVIGFFHPEVVGSLDMKIWVDAPMEVALARGKARDLALGRNHEKLWDEVWIPNELDFVANYDPHGAADLIFDAS